MAKEEKSDATEAPPKKSKKLLIIIIVAVLLLVLIGGGAAFLLMKKASHDDGEEVATETDKRKKGEPQAPPVYIALDTFTVNLVPETGEQYLQVAISVEAEEAAIAEQIKLYTPRLRHEIMNILSSKKPSEVASREGKKVLAEEIRKAINDIVSVEPAKGKPAAEAVRAVLFTTFIIQ